MIELASLHGVRLWQVDLDSYATQFPLVGLSVEEHERAQSFAFERDGWRFLASRHALRRVLGVVMGGLPREIRIQADEVGKPCCPDMDAVQFNLSHSAQYGLIGVSLNGLAVGVDVEVIRLIPEVNALVRSHFAPEERMQWAGISEHGRDSAFLSVWVRKEACLKALGVGLAAEPASINVSESSWSPKVNVPLGDRRCEVEVYPLNVLGEATAAIALAEQSSVALAREYFQAP